MDSLFKQYLSKVVDLVDSGPTALRATSVPGLGATSAPVTTPSQLVMPAIAWDWSVATSGSIVFEQFSFADTIPLSIQPETEYAPSSHSFSGNYRSFLDCIDDKSFRPPSLLIEAKKRICKPDGDPSSTPTPLGWTKVMETGIIRWEPIWETSDTAYKWKNKVEAGSIANPGTITLPLSTGSGLGTVLQRRDQGKTALQPLSQLGTTKFTTVEMSAAAWGQITVTPRQWFTASIIELGRRCLPSEMVPTFFDPDKGLLRGRVAAFIVGYKVTFAFKSTAPIGLKFANSIAAESDLYALGVPVEIDSPDSPEAAANSLNLRSKSEYPSIVAVVIETYASDPT